MGKRDTIVEPDLTEAFANSYPEIFQKLLALQGLLDENNGPVLLSETVFKQAQNLLEEDLGAGMASAVDLDLKETLKQDPAARDMFSMAVRAVSTAVQRAGLVDGAMQGRLEFAYRVYPSPAGNA